MRKVKNLRRSAEGGEVAEQLELVEKRKIELLLQSMQQTEDEDEEEEGEQEEDEEL
jgi:hypothetical protein